jgi:oligopeptide transport system substrate-binding protein
MRRPAPSLRSSCSLLLLATTAALALLAGCRPAGSPSSGASAGGGSAPAFQILRVGNSSEPKDLDPQTATAYTESTILSALFEGLTAVDDATAQPVPGVAERWDISADGLTYTFHLRADARWSNGDPVTAADFVWSFRRILSPKLASEYSYMVWPLKNAQAYNEGRLADFAQVGARAVDDRTLELTLGAPCPWLLALAAHQAWYPVHRPTIEKFGAAERQGTSWTRPENMVGNGPFTLKEWALNTRITVAKNPRYWDAARAQLDAAEFYPIENLATEEKTFRAGQLHVTYGLPPAKIPAWRDNKTDRGVLRVDPFLETFFLRFNTTKPPLDNAKLRQALARAIDRDAIARDVLRGSVTPARALTPPGTAGYTAAAGPDFGPAAARALLAEAGFPGGRGLPVFEMQHKSDDVHRAVMEAVQQMWERELGVKATLVAIEQKTWIQNQSSQAYQISSARWVGDYVDADTFLSLWLTGGGNNWTGWGDAAYDQLVTEAARTLDAEKRHALQRDAEARLLGTGPIIPIYHGARVFLIDPTVKGWTPNLLGAHRYQFISLE